MTGLSDFRVHDMCWADADIDRIEIDYSDVVVWVEDSTGRMREVHFKGYIGYSVVGFWDEMIVEEVVVHETHEFLDACVSNLQRAGGVLLTDSGDENRNKRSWRLAEIRLIDEMSILIVASAVEVREPGTISDNGKLRL